MPSSFPVWSTLQITGDTTKKTFTHKKCQLCKTQVGRKDKYSSTETETEQNVRAISFMWTEESPNRLSLETNPLLKNFLLKYYIKKKRFPFCTIVMSKLEIKLCKTKYWNLIEYFS